MFCGVALISSLLFFDKKSIEAILLKKKQQIQANLIYLVCYYLAHFIAYLIFSMAMCWCCRCLKTLFLEESLIVENDAKWLHELASNSTVLESLNFYLTELKIVPYQALELLAKNCQSLVSLKISDCDMSELIGFFQAARNLEDFAGGSFDEQPGEVNNRYTNVRFPPRLCRIGLTFMGTNEMPIIFPLAAALKKLDLQLTFLSTEDHCQLIQQCPNLEILEVAYSAALGVTSQLIVNCGFNLFPINSSLVFVIGKECYWRPRIRSCGSDM